MLMHLSLRRASAIRTARLLDSATDRAPNQIVLKRLIRLKESVLNGRAHTGSALRADRAMRRELGALDQFLNANAEPTRIFRSVAELERILADREHVCCIPKAEANRRMALQRMRALAEEIAMMDEYAREIAAQADCEYEEVVSREEFRSNRERARMLRRMLERLRIQARNLDGVMQTEEELENLSELARMLPDPDAFEKRATELLVREEDFRQTQARLENLF